MTLFGALAACGAPPPAVEHVSVALVPETLLTRQDAPAIPDPDTATQKDVAALLAHLWAWGEAGWGNVDAIAKIVHKQQQRLTR